MSIDIESQSAWLVYDPTTNGVLVFTWMDGNAVVIATIPADPPDE